MAIKGKKIACFVGLPHHTRFLWPITAAAEKKGADLVYVTTMSDYPFERELMKKGRVVRLLQEYSNAETAARIAQTKRDFYKLWAERCFKWDGYRHWPLNVMSGLTGTGIEEIHCMERFFEVEKPDAVLALHERNRWGKMLGHYTRKHGIPYLTMQEGELYEERISYSAHTEYSTALMLWGEASADFLAWHGSALEKMVLAGNTHLQQVQKEYAKASVQAQVRKDLGIPEGKPVVLFMLGLQWAVIKNLQAWKDLLGDMAHDDSIVKIFKWHPKVTYQSYKKNAEEVFATNFPSCIVLQNYDPYKLLAVSDCCVTFGKTTLAVEALAFGVHLFSLPGIDGTPDHYAKWGISQSIKPNGNWDRLYNTIKNGVPEQVAKKEEGFMESYFYKHNSCAVERWLEVVDFTMRKYEAPKKRMTWDKEMVPGRISYIVPTGAEPDALLATLASLSENVKHSDWEVVIVISTPEMKEPLEALSGDVVTVEHHSESLACLYNAGARHCSGEVLVFMCPGIAHVKDDGVLESANKCITGMEIRTAGMEPFCCGLTFDFNSVPTRITNPSKEVQAVGGGMLAVSRSLFESLKGFDEEIANQFVEADFCLGAKEQGIDCRILDQGLAVCMKETALNGGVSLEHWKERIAFFAKWRGRLPKDENYVEFAKKLLDTGT